MYFGDLTTLPINRGHNTHKREEFTGSNFTQLSETQKKKTLKIKL